MKFLAMADLHGQLPELNVSGIDAVFIAGDIAPHYSYNVREDTLAQTEWFSEEFHEWAVALRRPVFACYGNHDWGTWHYNRQLAVSHSEIPPLVTVSNANRIRVKWCEEYVDIVLFAWTKYFNKWNYETKDMDADPLPPFTDRLYDDSSIEARLGRLCGPQDGIPEIWVSHGPPYGHCDTVQGNQGQPIGSKALLAAAERHKPFAIVTGHCHTGRRYSEIGCYTDRVTKVFNCSLLNEDYAMEYEPVVFEMA